LPVLVKARIGSDGLHVFVFMERDVRQKGGCGAGGGMRLPVGHRRFMKLGLAFLMGGVIFFLLRAPSEGDELERLTLRGLDAVGVLVELLPPNLETGGVTWEQVRGEVESQLRGAGIKLLTLQETTRTPGHPYVYVEVSGKKSPSQFQAVQIRISLKQSVLLKRTASIEAIAETWSESLLVATEVASVKKVVRERLKDLVDRFIRDYRAVNPK